VTILADGTSTLTWSTTAADTVTIDPGIGSVAPSGSISISPSVTTTYVITARGAGGIATANVIVEVESANSPITLQITSPSGNETVSKPDVMVRGTITNTTGNETGVTVNGLTAIVEGNQFVANHVPLQEGGNIINAVAADVQGNTNSISIVIYGEVAANYLKITTDAQSGVSPLETIIRVESSFDLASLVISPTGPAAVDSLENLGDNEYKAVMSSNGIYYFTAEVTDDQSNTYTDTVAVQVLNLNEMDALLKARWDGMKMALVNRDIETATRYFMADSQDHYSDIFTALYDRLPQLSQDMRQIELIYVKETAAKYRIRKTENWDGQPYEFTFYIYFEVDSDGIWKIYRF
jgi:hypothetical protein